MTYYAALDVSLRSVAICIVDDQGEIHLERSVDSDVEDIVHCFAHFGQPICCTRTKWLLLRNPTF